MAFSTKKTDIFLFWWGKNPKLLLHTIATQSVRMRWVELENFGLELGQKWDLSQKPSVEKKAYYAFVLFIEFMRKFVFPLYSNFGVKVIVKFGGTGGVVGKSRPCVLALECTFLTLRGGEILWTVK